MVAKIQSSAQLMIPVSFGELVDKITILEIKIQKFEGLALEHVISFVQLTPGCRGSVLP